MTDLTKFNKFMTVFLDATDQSKADVIRSNKTLLQNLEFVEWVSYLAEGFSPGYEGSLRNKEEESYRRIMTIFLIDLQKHIDTLILENPRWHAVRTGVAEGIYIIMAKQQPFEFQCSSFLDRWILAGGGRKDTDEHPRLIYENEALLKDPRFAQWLTERVMDLSVEPSGDPARELYIQYIAVLSSYLSVVYRSDPDMSDIEAAVVASALVRQLVTDFTNAFFMQCLNDLISEDIDIVEKWRTIIIHPRFQESLIDLIDGLMAKDEGQETLTSLKTHLLWFGKHLARMSANDRELSEVAVFVHRMSIRISASEVPFFRSMFTRRLRRDQGDD